MIQPTIGRVVWFYESRSQKESSQPFPALVCFVQNQRSVNLVVFTATGGPYPGSHMAVPLLQDGDAPPPIGPWCEWMPYQKQEPVKNVEQRVSALEQWMEERGKELLSLTSNLNNLVDKIRRLDAGPEQQTEPVREEHEPAAG